MRSAKIDNPAMRGISHFSAFHARHRARRALRGRRVRDRKARLAGRAGEETAVTRLRPKVDFDAPSRGPPKVELNPSFVICRLSSDICFLSPDT